MTPMKRRGNGRRVTASERSGGSSRVSPAVADAERAAAVLAEAGAGPEHVTRMTWYILDRQEYRSALKDIGRVYRDIMGNNYPAMAMLQVSALIEDRARVEIETTAVIPD